MKKKISDIYGNLELFANGKETTYILSVGIDCDKENRRYMPSFQTSRNHESIDPDYDIYWDSEDYLYNIFYKEVVSPFVSKGRPINMEAFFEFINEKGVYIEDFPQINKLFEKADELNFFQELKKEKNGE